MSRKINNEKLYNFEPTSDFAFKHIFGMEEGKISLLSLLNAILDGKHSIKDVKILNSVLQNGAKN